MIRGVKGELKVRAVDISKLKNRNQWLEFNDSIMTDKWGSYPSIEETPNMRTAKSQTKKPARLYDVGLENSTFDSSWNGQLELPPIAKDLTKTPDIYSIRWKKNDLTSRDSASKGSNESPDFRQKLNKIRNRAGNSIDKRTVSPTFKT